MPQNRKHPSNRPAIGLGYRHRVQFLKPLADRFVTNTRVQARHESRSPETSGSCSLPSFAASRARTAGGLRPPSRAQSPEGTPGANDGACHPRGDSKRGGRGGARKQNSLKPRGLGNAPKASVTHTHPAYGAHSHSSSKPQALQLWVTPSLTVPLPPKLRWHGARVRDRKPKCCKTLRDESSGPTLPSGGGGRGLREISGPDTIGAPEQ